MATTHFPHAPMPLAGTKRSAPSDLDDEQRFTKRFNLLNLIDQPSRLYIPVPSQSQSQTQHLSPSRQPPHPSSLPNHLSPTIHSAPDPDDTPLMAIDETPSRIYIHDLDAELSSLPPDTGPQLIFLPDIERQLSRVPGYLLRPSSAEENKGKELVLYSSGTGTGMGARPEEGGDTARGQESGTTSGMSGLSGTSGTAGTGTGVHLIQLAIEETKRRKRAEVLARTQQAYRTEGTETAHGFGEGEWGSLGGEGRGEDRGEARRMGWGEIEDLEEQDEDEVRDGDAMDIG
ncbi:hypothetical protein KVT40_006628 [Elsinoe batatas]|uniref:Uncharacterized protein n=1 Tax=Elsinoe batatas TaxID=2601811 RepID=A0A8K0KWZ9_9PEZI|nr:hypothetical protein KVT40_006628 [Elsinoe batatas]